MNISIPPTHTHVNKQSVVFTWDDNRMRQINTIAPLFIEKDLRCTFYVNPGIENFGNTFSSGYKALAESYFEIASHGYSHQNMIEIDAGSLGFEFKEAIKEITRHVNVRPVTFAFPFHAVSDSVIAKARECYLETRNTLNNSICIRLQGASVFEDVEREVSNAVSNGNNVVFSGHSIITETEYLANESGEGWAPIRMSFLADILNYIAAMADKVEVVTFAQAAIKEFIKKHGLFNDNEYVFDPQSLIALAKVGVDSKMLYTIL